MHAPLLSACFTAKKTTAGLTGTEPGRTIKPGDNKPRPHHQAEGKGFEPSTPYGASDFESDCWPIRIPSSIVRSVATPNPSNLIAHRRSGNARGQRNRPLPSGPTSAPTATPRPRSAAQAAADPPLPKPTAPAPAALSAICQLYGFFSLGCLGRADAIHHSC